MDAQLALVRPSFASETDPLVALWICRLCIGIPATLRYLNHGGYSEEIRRLLGISPEDETASVTVLKPLVKRRLGEFEAQGTEPTTLSRNTSMLGRVLGLSELQPHIIMFATLMNQDQNLSEFIGDIRLNSIDGISKLLSTALRCPVTTMAAAVHPKSALIASRVVQITVSDHRSALSLEIPNTMRQALLTRVKDTEGLMKAFVETAESPDLGEDNFIHLAKESELLINYLTGVIRSKTPGVNILIYGAPGTGKTQYVRWLAKAVGKTLYQVCTTNRNGEAIEGMERLAYFQLSQHFLQNAGGLLLFDEIEDVFPSEGGMLERLVSGRRGPSVGKLFINQMLENNPVPTIWVSNAVRHIDRAYLRRFDYSFEMAIPPISVRRSILETYLGKSGISESSLEHLAQQTELSPAQIEKAAKVVGHIGRKSKSKSAKVVNGEATLLRVIDNSMELLGQDKTDHPINFTECGYQLAFLNPDCDVQQLVKHLKQSQSPCAALCFHGPPGTGKTALAHFIAQETELPLMVRRASDIISPYVGETEQNIAKMFRAAEQEGSVLLLDEADSFLNERQGARNSWEVTAVNEMLTQMERFRGLFICSTNLMQKLDPASLRRFTFKVKFDYLTPVQRWKLFQSQVKAIPKAESKAFEGELAKLSNLTPGDFANVRRQAKLLGSELSSTEWLKRLSQVSRSKSDQTSRPIGFLHPQ